MKPPDYWHQLRYAFNTISAFLMLPILITLGCSFHSSEYPALFISDLYSASQRALAAISTLLLVNKSTHSNVSHFAMLAIVFSSVFISRVLHAHNPDALVCKRSLTLVVKKKPSSTPGNLSIKRSKYVFTYLPSLMLPCQGYFIQRVNNYAFMLLGKRGILVQKMICSC